MQVIIHFAHTLTIHTCLWNIAYIKLLEYDRYQRTDDVLGRRKRDGAKSLYSIKMTKWRDKLIEIIIPIRIYENMTVQQFQFQY